MRQRHRIFDGEMDQAAHQRDQALGQQHRPDARSTRRAGNGEYLRETPSSPAANYQNAIKSEVQPD